MKKVFALCLLSLLLLSACSPQKSTPDQSHITLTLWHYYNGSSKDAFDRLVQSYNETLGKEQGVLIDAHAYSGVNELADAVFASAKQELGASNLPDIFAAYSDNVFRLDSLSMVASLDKYFTKAELEKYRSEFLTEGRFDQESSLKIIPIAKSTELLYLNATDFDRFASANGVSTEDLRTWESLAHTAKLYYNWTDAQTTQPGDGKALFGVDSIANFFLEASMQLGEELYQTIDGEMQFKLSKENAKRIWDNLYTPYLSGYYDSIGRFRSDDTKAGDLLAYVGSTASANYFPMQVETSKDSAYPIECIAMPYPYFEGGKKYAVQQGAGMVVSKSDERHERASVEFLKWFTAPEQNLKFAAATGYIPVQNDSLSYDKVIKEIEQNSEQGQKASVMQTAQIVFQDTLQNYTLYSSKPFQQSFETRKLLESSLMDYMKQDRERLAAGIAQGKDPASLKKELSSQENFEKWYLAFTAEMTALME